VNTERRNILAATALTLGGLALMWVLTLALDNVWYRMAAFYVFAIPAALLGTKLDWKAIFRFRWQHALIGLVAAGALYGLGWVGVRLIHTVLPDLAGEIGSTYGMLDDAPRFWVWPLLVFVIVGEEIVWRLAVTLAVADKFKVWGVAAGAFAFALVHLPWGPPLLLVAALVFGACWSAIAFKTRSFWASFVAHLGWDVLIMFVLPYQ